MKTRLARVAERIRSELTDLEEVVASRSEHLHLSFSPGEDAEIGGGSLRVIQQRSG